MGKWIIVSSAALMMGTMLLAADDAPAPATDTPAPRHHHSKLVKPYSDLSNLTDEQKTAIMKAHSDYLAAEKDLLAKEKSEIETVLTDDQKAELKSLEDKEISERKEKSAQRRQEKEETDMPATTQPAH